MNDAARRAQITRLERIGSQSPMHYAQVLPLIRELTTTNSYVENLGGSQGLSGPPHVPDFGPYLQPWKPSSRILIVGNIPLVLPGVITAPVQLRFDGPGPGVVSGLRGTAIDFTVGAFAAGQFEAATMGVEMQINDNEVLTTNGQNFDFARFSDLFVPGATTWFPFERRVRSTDIMNFRFQNFQPVVGGVGIQPTFALSFISDRDVAAAQLEGT